MVSEERFVEITSLQGLALLENLQACPADVTIFDLFPAMDIREDKLVEMRGAFGYEVKLTKIEHKEKRHGEYHPHRKDSKGGPRPRGDHKGTGNAHHKDRKDSRPLKDSRDKSNRNRSHSGGQKNKPARRKHSHKAGEEYYVRKDLAEQKPTEAKTDQSKKQPAAPKKKGGNRRRDSDDFIYVRKEVQTAPADPKETEKKETQVDAKN